MKIITRSRLFLSIFVLVMGSVCGSTFAQKASHPVPPLSVATAAPAPADQDGTLKVGATAPDFKLPYATQEKIFLKPEDQITLSSLRGKTVILAFYPADFSGGCTTEVCTLRDSFADLGKLNATVLGVSGDYVFSHHEWAVKNNLPFALASDHNHAVAKQYGSYNEAMGFNNRTIYLIDKTGVIRYINLEFKAGDKAGYDTLKAEIEKLNKG